LWYLRPHNLHKKGCEVNANGHAGAGWHVPLPGATHEVLAEWKLEGTKRICFDKIAYHHFLPVSSSVDFNRLPATNFSALNSARI